MNGGRNYDIVVVGAGIIGLTVARELRHRRPGARIALFEKEADLGRHASGRNSGVLHAGIYYASDTLKARVCAKGGEEMRRYAAERGIRVQKTGKVIVATRTENAGQIDVLEKRARDAGIRVERLDARALAEVEPHARSSGDALYSPDTAVIDARAVLSALREDLRVSGVDLFLSTGIVAARPEERTIFAKKEAFHYGHLVNCAGTYSDKVAHQFGVGLQYGIVPFRGSYRRLSDVKNGWVRGSIYPVPDLRYPFLGVHLTRGIDGDVFVGPTATPAMGRENYRGMKGMDLREFPLIAARLLRMYYRDEDNFRGLVRSEAAKSLGRRVLKEVQAMVPGLEGRDLVRCGKVGIRAQLVNTVSWRLEMDFILESGPHSTHVLNAISPAFTGAFEFAKLVADRVGQSG